MYRTQKSILIALAIGDGTIEKSTTHKGSRLKVGHGEKQLEYLKYKRDLLHSVIGGKIPKIYHWDQVRKGTKNRAYAFRKGHKYFWVLRKWLYPKGKKVLSRRILDNLTPEGVAIWYMDDGNLWKHINKDLNKVTSFRITLSTEVYLEEAEMIQEYFKDVWGVSFHTNKSRVDNDGKMLYRHRCSTKEARKFFDIVEPYIIESMKYKIDVPDYLRHEC